MRTDSSLSARSVLVLLCLLPGLWQGAVAYPLDGGDESNIRRLQGYQNAQDQSRGTILPAGALLGIDDIRLSLKGQAGVEFDTTGPDPDLQRALEQLLKRRDPSYAVTVIDISDPEAIRWASVRPDSRQNPGSVGKLLCMLALFDGLARAFPDTAEREKILRETVVYAGDWVTGDTHEVPRFQADTGRNKFAVLRPTDSFYLSEWLDHMVSASANGAGSVVWREAMLLRRFGDRYPLTPTESEAFFSTTPAAELSALAQQVITDPLLAAGLDPESLRQGGFWTWASKRKVVGSGSYASAGELARFLFRLEQGRLVDAWSSLEMKRYLYITKRRYRYAFAPELNAAAVYFKSGSLYQCKPETDFVCRKYHGNVRNLMNSAAIVESPAAAPGQRRYIVALMSNVLRKNSAWDHSRIAAAIEKLLNTGSAKIQDQGSEKDMAAAGQG